MEGYSFVTPVTGLNRPNTGKEDDDDDDDFFLLCRVQLNSGWRTTRGTHTTVS
jgi:hypothetical protein